MLYCDRNGAVRAVRRGPGKLVLGDGDRADGLYHLEHDVRESRDVSQQLAALVDDLRVRALARSASIDADARPVGRHDTTLFDPRFSPTFPEDSRLGALLLSGGDPPAP
ncbi:MAG: hypothetical protein R3F49_09535 [Planctomycetota bacterium]